MTDDVLEHNNGVVHDETDREDQRHHGHIVQAVVEHVHHGESADQRKRQGHGGDHGGRDVPQEQEDPQDHQDHGYRHGERNVVEVVAVVLRAVTGHLHGKHR